MEHDASPLASPLPDFGALQPLLDKDWSALVDLTEEGEPLAQFWRNLVDLLTAREAGREVYLDPAQDKAPQVALEERLAFALNESIVVTTTWLDLLERERPDLAQGLAPEISDMRQLLVAATSTVDHVLTEAGIRETHHYGMQWMNSAEFDIVFKLERFPNLTKESSLAPAITRMNVHVSRWNLGPSGQHIHGPIPERNAQARAELRAAFDGVDRAMAAMPPRWDLSVELQRELDSLRRLIVNGRNELRKYEEKLTKYEEKYGAISQ